MTRRDYLRYYGDATAHLSFDGIRQVDDHFEAVVHSPTTDLDVSNEHGSWCGLLGEDRRVQLLPEVAAFCQVELARAL